jgi:hypothetical protein
MLATSSANLDASLAMGMEALQKSAATGTGKSEPEIATYVETLTTGVAGT